MPSIATLTTDHYWLDPSTFFDYSDTEFSYTVSLWFKIDATPSGVEQYPIDANIGSYLSIGQMADGSIDIVVRFGLEDEPWSVQYTFLNSITRGVWHNIQVWLDYTTRRYGMDLDGVSLVDETNPLATAYVIGLPLAIGLSLGADGVGYELDEIVAWKNVCLTADQRAYLYNSGLGRTYPFS